IDVEKKYIVGYNQIFFKITAKKAKKIQLDLYQNMQVDSIVFENKKLNYKREFNAVFIDFPYYLTLGFDNSLKFYYSGNPQIAKHAPWDGGFVFSKDKNNKDFVGVACQGAGASLWFPCKDSQSDEPNDGVTISIEAPTGLIAVSNGRLLNSFNKQNGFTRWDWQVKNPINAYDITVNIADYVHFGENYKGLDLDYYVLRENEAKAKVQFEQVKPMMDCFQTKFGEYPFKNDGYKLVETPYLAMEHQSAVAYGNTYQNGYQGTDLSGTGIGLSFDYIIIHESGHEWFGNSITSKDIADMWIHEGFTMYSEAVFLECQMGKQKAQEYLRGMQKNVQNDKPIIGPYGVNKEGSGDMYYKGALMLNTIRSIVNDDDKWWRILYKYSLNFRHKIIDNQTVVNYFNKELGLNLSPIFEQYLKYKNIPTLELKIEKRKLMYKWVSDIVSFNMPVDIKIKGNIVRIYPKNDFQSYDLKIKKMNEVEVLNDQYYINVKLD
ncbi:MAG: M1 family metallopeptidase, partial [Flavobacterium sp.]|nr:M1 family metallopeptidase [Flavobacterium sp.]